MKEATTILTRAAFAHRSKGENFLVLRRLVRNIMHGSLLALMAHANNLAYRH